MNTTPSRHKLIIDADPGILDALAIIIALIDPEIDLLAITATPGVVSGLQANENLQTIINRLDPPKYPRLGCCEPASPRTVHALNNIDVNLLYGENGLGECPVSAVSLASPHPAAKVLSEIVRTHPHEVTLLTLGPLTNLILASELHPSFLQELKGLICLGGAVSTGGDITAAAEANIYADPEAARKVLRADVHKTLVPLDVSDRLMLTFGDLDRLPHDTGATVSNLIDQLLPFAMRSARRHLGQEGITLKEIAALAVVTRPQLFSRKVMAVDIEVQGPLTRGMTVFDRRSLRHWEGNVEVVTEIETEAVLDYFTGVLWNALENP